MVPGAGTLPEAPRVVTSERPQTRLTFIASTC
jgi:hypothetical protein